MKNHRVEYSVEGMCACFCVSRSGWMNRKPSQRHQKGVIAHSDRGSQYYSHVYRKLLETNHMQGRMSARGNCYDNACAESFFHSLKVGLSTVKGLLHAKPCVKLCLNTLKPTIIGFGYTLPIATGVR